MSSAKWQCLTECPLAHLACGIAHQKEKVLSLCGDLQPVPYRARTGANTRDLHRVSGLLMKLVPSMYRQCHSRCCGLKILTPVNGSLLCSGQLESLLLEMFLFHPRKTYGPPSEPPLPPFGHNIVRAPPRQLSVPPVQGSDHFC